MAHAHHHSSDELPPASPRARRLLVALLVPLALATVVGLVVLWPDEVRPDLGDELGAPDELYDARVVEAEEAVCPGLPEGAEQRCVTPVVELLDGPDEGEEVALDPQSAESTVRFEVGDTVVVSYLESAEPGFEYAFADLERRTPLLLLALLFAGAVLLLGRFQGLRALLGLGLSLVVLTTFILPAVLGGRSPLAVALVGSSLIAFVSLYLAHGLNARTTTALLGSLASLGLVGLLSAVFVGAADLTGMADEDAMFLTVGAADLDLSGLLLGGFIIGALGVLDDVTITQASAVWELHQANPRYTHWDLYRSAVRIGRDHIASTVNTLVLAYAGASLPLFLLFLQNDVALMDAVNGETVAVEIVRTLCGSIGLVASVPVTTALAAAVVVGSSPAVAPGAPSDGDGDDGDDGPGDAGPADEHGPDVSGDDDGGTAAPDGAGAAPVGAASPAPTPAPAPADPRTFRSRREREFWGDDEAVE